MAVKGTLTRISNDFSQLSAGGKEDPIQRAAIEQDLAQAFAQLAEELPTALTDAGAPSADVLP